MAMTMTPTDALIEKMARAFYEAQWDGSWDDAAPVEQAAYRFWIRAAYEAEHEETKG